LFNIQGRSTPDTKPNRIPEDCLLHFIKHKEFCHKIWKKRLESIRKWGLVIAITIPENSRLNPMFKNSLNKTTFFFNRRDNLFMKLPERDGTVNRNIGLLSCKLIGIFLSVAIPPPRESTK